MSQLFNEPHYIEKIEFRALTPGTIQINVSSSHYIYVTLINDMFNNNLF